MSITPSDRLYQLLPAIYRIRDTERQDLQNGQAGGPLQKFLVAIEQELQTLENDISGLYENWYIETCEDWVVPYIGNLVGIRDLYTTNSSPQADQRPYGIQERRAYVANTIAYRRRKGTASVLEQLARDITGWGARVVEFWDLLALNQNLDHIRTQNTTVNLRSTTLLDLLGTPFESHTAYTVQVRPTRGGNGRYNVPAIGLYIWRLTSYPIQGGTARLATEVPSELMGRGYTFSPLEFQIKLFNRPQTETEITQLAEEVNLPIPLPRRADFAGYRGKNPVLKVWIDGQSEPISPEEVLITALDDWRLPTQESSPRTKVVAVDPKLGRIAFLDRILPQQVEVSYAYGFSGDVGGGPYHRDLVSQLPPASSPSLTWEIAQAHSASLNPLAEAIQSWNGTLLAWQGLNNQTCIPLAKITIPEVNVISLLRESEPPPLRAGIIEGLEVIALPGTTVAVVTPGRAIDGKGRAIAVNCSSSLDLSLANLDGLAQQAVLLVVSYRASRDDRTWQFSLISLKEFNAERDRYPDTIYLALAYLVLNQNSEVVKQFDRTQVSSVPLRPQFSPGIVDRFDVLTPPGALAAIVLPGMAVDSRGRSIILPRNTAVALKDYQGQTVWIVISAPSRSSGQTWQLQVISEADAQSDRYPETVYFRLAHLEVPTYSIDSIELLSRTQSTTEETQPGVVRGLQVSRGEKLGEIVVSKGKAVDSQGQSLVLKRDYRLDFTSISGQGLILFIAQQQELGWKPIEVIDAPKGSEDWQQLGIVPEPPPEREPETIYQGTIWIQDSATYCGDLELEIPADWQLTIVADNGDRPHILGNISVRGIASVHPKESNIVDQGELTLNGLLIEGKLSVAPGNLRWLNLRHCTLVPQQGGLIVHPSPTSLDAEEGETWTLIALVLYCINLIGKLIQTGFKADRQAPQLLTQLNQLAYQEAQRIFSILQQIVQNSQSASRLEKCFPAETLDDAAIVANAQLKITIVRSICGAVQLTDIVPKLEITDSIIDRSSNLQGLSAIAAPQTEVAIATSTVFGRTSAGTLEGSNSIFNEPVTVTRRQPGCLRFCYVPDGSTTPPRYRCQPDLALKEELDPLPKAILSLAVEKKHNHWFAGTAGDGIYHSLDRGDNWMKIENAEIAEEQITALIANAIGTISSQGTTVIGENTLFTQVFQVEDAIVANNQIRTVEAIASDTTLTVDESFDEDLSPETSLFIPLRGKGKINSDDVTIRGQGTAFTAELREGDIVIAANQIRTITSIQSNTQATIDRAFEADLLETPFFVTYRGQGTISSTGNTVTGENTAFLQSFQKGDAIIANHQIRTVEAVASDRELTINDGFSENLQAKTPFYIIPDRSYIFAGTGRGKVWFSSNGDEWQQVDTGANNAAITAIAFYAQLGTGTINRNNERVIGKKTAFKSELAVGDTITAADQTRTVQEIISDTELIVDRPFPEDLPPDTSFRINYFLAGTEGSGVFRFSQSGNWQPFNLGLTNPNITALAVGSDRVFAGTAGGGVFRFSGSENRWEAINCGLSDLQITALATDDEGEIFAGTVAGGVFVSSVRGERWTMIEGIPVNLKVRALVVAYSQTLQGHPVHRRKTTVPAGDLHSAGQLDSDGTTITINEPGDLELKPGDRIVSAGQTRTLTAVEDLSLTIDAKFSPPLPSEAIEFTVKRLVVATEGGIFTLPSEETEPTTPIANLSLLNVTTMAIAPDRQILAGTSLGSILASSDVGQTWTARDRGLVSVERKLALLAELQPGFTSRTYGKSGYAQLGPTCPPQISTGAEDGSEMGVFSYLKQPQRQQNLNTSVDEYLRCGLEAGIFYVT